MTGSNADNDTRPAASRSGRSVVLATAQELTDRQSAPVTLAAPAAQAGVNKRIVSEMRPQLDELFPGQLGSARERVLAAARTLASQRSGPVTVVTVAAQANVNRATVARMRAELERLFPGRLRPAAERPKGPLRAGGLAG